MDFKEARTRMVKEQISGRDITDNRVIMAMLKVERHKFIDEKLWEQAYEDHPLPIGTGQTISQPYMVALMTQCLQLSGSEKVLEIGTGSGYQSAILSELSQQVYSIERIEQLSRKARELLKKLNFQNIKIHTGDGTLGWEEYAPYDGIIVTAGAKEVPAKFFSQLAEGGRLVIPLGERFSQTLTVVKKEKHRKICQPICECVFVPLIGKYGWKEEEF